MAKHEKPGTPFFRMIRTDVYNYAEGRAAAARERNREFVRPIFGDPAIQVLIEAIRARQGGDTKAEVATVMGKVNPAAAMFLNQYLEQVNLASLKKSSVTLSAAEREQLIQELKPIVRMSAARRAALTDVIRTVLPKVDGSLRTKEFEKALEQGNIDQFVDWADDNDEGEVQ